MIWIILTLGLITRCISLNQSLWLDESINVLATQSFSLMGIIVEYAKADFHPPGFFIILWLWTHIFGIGEIFVRIPSVIFGTLTIYLFYLLGKKIHSKNLGLIAALLLAINPLHVYYSQEARMYALATFAVVLNFILFIKLSKKEKVRLIYLVIGNLLVLSADYVAYLIFPSQLIFLLLTRQKEVFKFYLKGFFIALVLGIWWIPVFLSQFKIGSQLSTDLPIWKSIVGGFDFKAPALTLVKFIIGRISLSNKTIYYLAMLPVCSIFFYLIFRGIKYCKDFSRNLLIIWLLVPIILAILISFIIPIYSYFRLLFVLPAFLILVALGIVSYKDRLKYIFLGGVIFIQTLASSVYLFNSSYQREDWRGLVDYLRSQNGDFIVLFESSDSLPPFDYYAGGEINVKGALSEFPAKDMDDIAQLSSLYAKDVYLVEYLVDISDPQRLVQKRLGELNYREVEIKNFNGVGLLYHYVKTEYTNRI